MSEENANSVRTAGVGGLTPELSFSLSLFADWLSKLLWFWKKNASVSAVRATTSAGSLTGPPKHSVYRRFKHCTCLRITVSTQYMCDHPCRQPRWSIGLKEHRSRRSKPALKSDCMRNVCGANSRSTSCISVIHPCECIAVTRVKIVSVENCLS